MLSDENIANIRDIMEKQAERYLFKEKCQGNVRLNVSTSMLDELLFWEADDNSKYFAVSDDEELLGISKHTNLTDVKIINEYEELVNTIIKSFDTAINEDKLRQKNKSATNKS